MVTIVMVGLIAGAIVAMIWATINPEINPEQPEQHHTRDWDDDGWIDEVDDEGKPVAQRWTYEKGWQRL